MKSSQRVVYPSELKYYVFRNDFVGAFFGMKPRGIACRLLSTMVIAYLILFYVCEWFMSFQLLQYVWVFIDHEWLLLTTNLNRFILSGCTQSRIEPNL